ncbi:2-aminoadipate transaminase [Malassezia pachydermatis]|uniref:Aminotransferase n=1 Tax=Malassezia pachydermatis TaxID=77020 RepID=A0A0M8MVQ0_9BASI|nr:aminotransferase [Malassezia pachydermatis]KOS15274.1 aminotransferase [Malassezia pachydermatis]
MYTQFDEKDPNYLDLQSGAPHRDLLPLDIIRTSTQLSLDQSLWPPSLNGLSLQDYALQYSPNDGSPEIRESIASTLSGSYSNQKDLVKERIMLHTGASQGLMTLLTWLQVPTSSQHKNKRPLPHLYLPTTTYFIALSMFQEAGIDMDKDVTIVDEQNDGINLVVLEEELKKRTNLESDAKYDGLLYLIPTHANPTSTILSDEKRRQLVALAQQYRLLVVTDDVYELLTFPPHASAVPPRLAWYDMKYGSGKNVIGNNSFSKVLGPGLRVGYYEADPSILQELYSLGWIESGGCPSNFASRMLLPLFCEALTPHFPQVSSSRTALEHVVSQIQSSLEARCQYLIDAIEEYLFPLGFTLPYGKPCGGYFLFLGLPSSMEVATVLQALEDVKIYVSTSKNFCVQPSKLKQALGIDCLRISFTFYNQALLRPRLARLVEVLQP